MLRQSDNSLYKTITMKTFETLTIDTKTADVDDKTRRVKNVLNRLNVEDFDKDTIVNKAFDNTIKLKGPKGKNLIWHLVDHNPSLKDGAITKFSELYVEKDELIGISTIPEKIPVAEIAFEQYKLGNINQHSIGFRTIKREVINPDDYTKRRVRILEVDLFEGSAVLWGANEFTPNLSVGKSLTKEEKEQEWKKTIEEWQKFTKMLKAGHLSDEAYELIDLKIIQITDKLQKLYNEANHPEVNSGGPDEESKTDTSKGETIRQLDLNSFFTLKKIV